MDYVPGTNAFHRKAKLQNTVMQILIERRYQRNKPSLSTLYMKFKALGFDKSLINDRLKQSFMRQTVKIQDEQIARYKRVYKLLQDVDWGLETSNYSLKNVLRKFRRADLEHLENSVEAKELLQEFFDIKQDIQSLRLKKSSRMLLDSIYGTTILPSNQTLDKDIN